VRLSSRLNLTVLVSAYVNRIIVESEADEAVARGVEFSHGGRTYVAIANKEVILSAGKRPLWSKPVLTIVDILGCSAIKTPQV